MNSTDKTRAMDVANPTFIVDKLGQECAPLQFLRELTQNGIEAIMVVGGHGEVTWDVDWPRYELDGILKLSVTDNGAGMTGEI
jgi:hypothetical protein